jgi:hypothetical protein
MEQLTREQMQAEIERLKAEANALKQAMGRKHTIKRSEKGAVSIYGFGRFPVTLYAPSWLELLKMAKDIETFINDNKATLSWEKVKE